MTSPDALTYVIYQNPSDYPGRFVVRGWGPDGFGNAAPLVVVANAESLAAARAALPEGVFYLGRTPDDDPCVVEVWI